VSISKICSIIVFKVFQRERETKRESYIPPATADVCHRNTSIPVFTPHPCVCSVFFV